MAGPVVGLATAPKRSRAGVSAAMAGEMRARRRRRRTVLVDVFTAGLR
jgi:hypothetical protein